MNVETIIEILKREGEEGCTKTERYVEIYDNVTLDNMELAQMIWLGDEGVLQAYFLDENNEGTFIDWDDLPEKTKNEILNLKKWN